MSKYSEGDTATYHFVVKNTPDLKIIKGFTDDKKLAEFYMEFHKCKNFILKSVTKQVEEFSEIFDENRHDEISLCNIIIKDRNKKGSHISSMVIPATETEIRFIDEECNSFMSSRINYGYLNGAIPYLSKKYQKALKDIFLNYIINRVMRPRHYLDKFDEDSPILEMDQLLLLFHSFPDEFE